LNQEIIWKEDPCITIVAAAKGYPDKYEIGSEIKNLENIKTNDAQQIFHAGTYKKDKKILSNGGRVLNVTCTAPSLKQARNKALDILNLIEWKDMYFRKDIGWRVIN
jgi:Phosphoribosylamine-glycine ligase